MKHLFVRCSGGHYFRATNTPARLRERGVSDDLLARLVIVEFGAEASAFDALVPERYVHRGAEVLAHEADSTLF